MADDNKVGCPFVYSNGRKCSGYVARARLYGHKARDPIFFAKKIRLWCSEYGDHCGIVSSPAGKNRMEFYPDQLSDEVLEAIEDGLIPTT